LLHNVVHSSHGYILHSLQYLRNIYLKLFKIKWYVKVDVLVHMSYKYSKIPCDTNKLMFSIYSTKDKIIKLIEETFWQFSSESVIFDSTWLQLILLLPKALSFLNCKRQLLTKLFKTAIWWKIQPIETCMTPWQPCLFPNLLDAESLRTIASCNQLVHNWWRNVLHSSIFCLSPQT